MSKIYPYAGFWKRFGAFVVDSLVLSIPTGVVYGLWIYMSFRPLLQMGSGSAPSPDVIMPMILKVYGGAFAFQLFSVVLFWLYYAFMESSAGQATLGKRVFGIKVVGDKGQRITFWHATGRTLGKFVSAMTLYIGFLIAGANKHKQALHDIMASTYVVDKDFQPGQELPEVQTHYVALSVSIAALFAAFLLPFALLVLLGIGQAMSEVNSDNDIPDFSTFDNVDQSADSIDMKALQRRIEDGMAQSKLYTLKDLPKEQQKPLTENNYTYTFEDDGTVVAKRTETPAAYALIMKPGSYWPCCQPYQPDGCKDVENADLCE